MRRTRTVAVRVSRSLWQISRLSGMLRGICWRREILCWFSLIENVSRGDSRIQDGRFSSAPIGNVLSMLRTREGLLDEFLSKQVVEWGLLSTRPWWFGEFSKEVDKKGLFPIWTGGLGEFDSIQVVKLSTEFVVVELVSKFFDSSTRGGTMPPPHCKALDTTVPSAKDNFGNSIFRFTSTLRTTFLGGTGGGGERICEGGTRRVFW